MKDINVIECCDKSPDILLAELGINLDKSVSFWWATRNYQIGLEFRVHMGYQSKTFRLQSKNGIISSERLNEKINQINEFLQTYRRYDEERMLQREVYDNDVQQLKNQLVALGWPTTTNGEFSDNPEWEDIRIKSYVFPTDMSLEIKISHIDPKTAVRIVRFLQTVVAESGEI
jgi:hypothetical protein